MAKRGGASPSAASPAKTSATKIPVVRINRVIYFVFSLPAVEESMAVAIVGASPEASGLTCLSGNHSIKQLAAFLLGDLNSKLLDKYSLELF